jgi:hypothetical protein
MDAGTKHKSVLFRNTGQEIPWHTAYIKKSYGIKQFIASTLCGSAVEA